MCTHACVSFCTCVLEIVTKYLLPGYQVVDCRPEAEFQKCLLSVKIPKAICKVYLIRKQQNMLSEHGYMSAAEPCITKSECRVFDANHEHMYTCAINTNIDDLRVICQQHACMRTQRGQRRSRYIQHIYRFRRCRIFGSYFVCSFSVFRQTFAAVGMQTRIFNTDPYIS